MNTAAAPDLSTPYGVTQQMCRVALAELLQLGLGVARVAARLVDAESRALKVMDDAAEAAAHGIMAAPDSYEAAGEAGRVADASDAARAGMVARMASIMDTSNRASRCVRMTAALAMRVEQPMRPARDCGPRGETRVRMPGLEETPERARSERLDEPELHDEIGDRTAEAIIRDICRDLGLRMIPGEEAPSPMAACVQAILRRAACAVALTDGVGPNDGAGPGDGVALAVVPVPVPAPDT